MAGSVNKAILVGNLGQDPEVRKLSSGDPVVSLSVATSESWRDKATGERREKTEWHRVVVFNENLARFAEQYLRKGTKVYVEGQIMTRSYEDRGGQTKYVTEIVLQKFRGEIHSLDRQSNRPPAADDPDAYGRESGRQQSGQAGAGGGNAGDFGPGIDDEIPF